MTFAQGDFSGIHLQDAFGRTEIAVLVDKNQDGMIRIGSTASDDYISSNVPAVGGLTKPLTDGAIVRASVIFYSPGLGATAGDIIKSWE